MSPIRLTSAVQFYDPGETETVVFDPLSGNTHLLTAIGARVLKRLHTARAPVDLADLLRSLRAASADGEGQQTLRSVVAELEELGLVEIIH